MSDQIQQIADSPKTRAAERIATLLVYPAMLIALGWLINDFSRRVEILNENQTRIIAQIERMETTMQHSILFRVQTLESRVDNLSVAIQQLTAELARNQGYQERERDNRRVQP